MWNNKNVVKNVQKIRTEITVTPEARESASIDLVQFELMVKEKLAMNLVKELAQNNYITYYSEKSLGVFQTEYKYKAELTVAGDGISQAFIDDYVYTVQGMEYNHDKIEEAIKVAFPEDFL